MYKPHFDTFYEVKKLGIIWEYFPKKLDIFRWKHLATLATALASRLYADICVIDALSVNTFQSKVPGNVISCHGMHLGLWNVPLLPVNHASVSNPFPTVHSLPC